MGEKITLDYCLKFFPLRVSLTDFCNLRCFFCSNEGLPLCQKNKTHINTQKFKKLIKILALSGLKKLSLTGGDPTMHPDITEIIDFLGDFNFDELFFHTNGVGLNDSLIKKIGKKFTKIAVSIHSVHFDTWKRMTNGTEKQFENIRNNLESLSLLNGETAIELKCVPIKGYNFSESEIKDFLEFCDKFAFKFKFLNFEPISKDHLKLSVPIKEINKTLVSIGCEIAEQEKIFRGQPNYLPIKRFNYGRCSGVAIEIGCGEDRACRECYRSNEIFVTPNLKIKPCHMDDYEIDLNKSLEEENGDSLAKSIIDSRIFLSKAPGKGLTTWQKK